jgi:hypothetical protein
MGFFLSLDAINLADFGEYQVFLVAAQFDKLVSHSYNNAEKLEAIEKHY